MYDMYEVIWCDCMFSQRLRIDTHSRLSRPVVLCTMYNKAGDCIILFQIKSNRGTGGLCMIDSGSGSEEGLGQEHYRCPLFSRSIIVP